MQQNEIKTSEDGEDVLCVSESTGIGDLHCESFAIFFEECAQLAGIPLAEWEKSEPF